MDKKDQKLLYELSRNARQSENEIAKKLQLSKQVVNYRIKRLEKSGIIQSYHPYINWRVLGYNAIRVYFKWQNINPEKEQAIYNEMKKDNFFMWIVKIEGDVDVGVYIWIRSIPEFAKKWHEWISKYKTSILKYELFESINMVHYPFKFFTDKPEYSEIVLGNEDQLQEYDQLDYHLLKEMTHNARISLVELAKKLKLSSKTVMQRLKKLEEKGIIKGYFALINTQKLGYQFYKVDFYLSDLSKLSQMHEFAKTHRDIVYRMRTIGGPDYEIEIMVKDTKEMKKIVQEIRTKFPNIIQHYRFHRLEYTIKQEYLPGVQ